MRRAAFVVSILIVLNSSDCDPQKQNNRISQLEADVKQLKADVVELKQKPREHHYELRNEGFRTWRFDPTTGDTCIQLTSEADWKRKQTMSESCGCADSYDRWYQMPKNTNEEKQAASNYYEWFVKSSCGIQ